MAKNNNFFNLYLRVNDKEAKNTIHNVSKDLRTLYAYKGNLDPKLDKKKWEEASRKIVELKEKKADLIKQSKQFEASISDSSLELQDFTSHVEGAMSSLMSGDLIGFREGMDGVKSGISGATRAAWAFIATPVGAALATLAAVAGSAKMLWDYNSALEETNKQLRTLGVSAEEMDAVRSEVEAVAETYDKEFSEIAKNAKSLSVSFGISMSEAIDVISRGLADGGKMNEEFMDSLGEYDEFFAQAGYSAQQFIDVINQGVELGIYSDKLPDAIKEAGLSLREQTDSTREALTNAFGATFSKELLSKIDKGEMTVREGLEAIAEQAEKTGLTQQQQAQLTADIFKGAGEDAGGAMKVLEAVSKSAQRELSETARAEIELTEANEKLNKVQSQLFGISGFGELWVKIKTVSVNAITGILTYLQTMKIVGAAVATEVTNFFVGMANNTITTVQLLVDKASPLLRTLGTDVKELQRSLQSIKLEEVNFVANISPLPETETPDPDPINVSYNSGDKDIDTEVNERVEKEKSIREKVNSALDDWESEAKVVMDAEDPLEEAAKLASEKLKIFTKQKTDEFNIQQKYSDKELALMEAIANQKKRIQELQVQWTEMSEDQKLSAITGAISIASQAFNEGSDEWKAAKITETIIATYQGAQNAFSALAGIPVVGPALGTAAAAAAIGAGMKRVQAITSAKVPKMAKGGYTDMFGLGYKDETGHEVAGIVHKDEYVVPKIVRQDPEVPPILNYLEKKRKKALNLYADGGDTVDTMTAPSGSQSGDVPSSSRAIELLEDILEATLMANNILFGYEAELERQKMEEKLKKIKDRSKIKK